MSRLLVEFYDSENINNICALLAYRYDEMVFFCGPDDEPGAREEKLLAEVISTHFGVKPEFVTMNTKSIEKAALLIEERIGGCDADIDITGGSGLYSAAAGYYLKKSGNKSRVLLFDTASGNLIFASPEKKERDDVPPMSFAEMLKLNGHSVISVGGDGNYNFKSRTLRTEIIRLWDATKNIPADWNRFCSLTHEDVTADHVHPRLRRKLKKEEDRIMCERVMAALKKKHIIYSYAFVKDGAKEYLEYELYYSARTKSLYDKAGTALEMFTCLAAVESGVFRDAQTGVAVDLDGKITKSSYDPKNEIDMTAMLGPTPVFISCKNTVPTKEYIYEIREMARYFGGGNAISVLCCTPEALEGVRERAEQMGVILIDGLHSVSLTAFRDILIEKFKE